MDIMECPEAVVNALGKSNMIGTSSLVYLVPYVWKPIAVLIPLVQWCMLATVIVFTTEQYNSGSCPGNAGLLSKVLMTSAPIDSEARPWGGRRDRVGRRDRHGGEQDHVKVL